jgi:hypothetical protein
MEDNPSLLALVLTGERHPDQVDYEWRVLGKWIMLSVRAADRATGYPFTLGQGRLMLKAFLGEREKDFPSVMNKCGWALKKSGDILFFEARGMKTETKLTLTQPMADQFFSDLSSLLEKPLNG